jgi:hypothetical protein
MKLSRLFQIGLLLTFFLPFFRECSPLTGQSAKELEFQKNNDSLQAVAFIDSVKSVNPNCNVDSLLEIKNSTNNIADSLSSASKNIDSARLDKLNTKGSRIDKSSTGFKNKIESILNPDGNFTGISYVIDSMFYLFYLVYLGGTTVAFILWIIGLILKYKKNILFHIINIIGLIVFFCAYFDKVKYDFKLWGYWVCFSWGLIMVIIDFIIMIKRKNKKTVA